MKQLGKWMTLAASGLLAFQLGGCVISDLLDQLMGIVTPS